MVQAAITRGHEARESGGFAQYKLAPYAFISPVLHLVRSLFFWRPA